MMNHIIEVTDEQVDYGIFMGQRIYQQNRKCGYKDMGEHARQNPQKVNFIGFTGETIVADNLGVQRPQVEKGLDNGYDFEVDEWKIQLKTTETPYLILFPREFIRMRSEYNINNTPIIFSVLRMDYKRLLTRENMFVRVYYCTFEEFNKQKKVRNFGYGSRYVLPIGKMHKGIIPE